MAGLVLVKVGKVPGRVDEYAIDGQPTVETALKTAGLKVGKHDEVRVNGGPAALDAELHNNDVVLLTPQVKGA